MSYDPSDLSSSYAEGQRIVRGFKLHGMEAPHHPMDPGGVADTGVLGDVGGFDLGDAFAIGGLAIMAMRLLDTPQPEAPPAVAHAAAPAVVKVDPVEMEARRELESCRSRLKALVQRRERQRALLEKQRDDRRWEQELSESVRESQEAQAAAIETSLSTAAAGLPQMWERMRADQIEHLASQIKVRQKVLTYPHLEKDMMDPIFDGLARNYKELNEAERMRGYAKFTQAWVGRISKLVGLTSTVETIGDKHAALLASKQAEEIVTKTTIMMAQETAKLGAEWTLDHLEGKAAALGATGARIAAGSGIARWMVEYGYQGGRFWLAWGDVDRIVQSMDDRLKTVDIFRQRMEATTQELARQRGTCEQLKGAMGNPDAMLRNLQRLREERRQRSEWARQSFWSSMDPQPGTPAPR
jgi:hypothetical protein